MLEATAEGDPAESPSRQLSARLRLVAGLLRDAGPLPSGKHPWLLWRGTDGGVQRRAVDRPLIIGRESQCDVVLNYPMVSRRHCRITPGISVNWIEDLGSTHGTKIGVIMKQPQILRNGDLIEAGRAALAFVANSEIQGLHV